MNSLDKLHESVLATRRCTVCGACLALCPHLDAWRGRVVRVHDCELEQGRCADGCPRLAFDPIATAQQFNTRFDPLRDARVGAVLAAHYARSNDPQVRAVGQDGGVVSALVSFALSEGDVSSAILTGRRGELEGEGRCVTTGSEVLACAGSRYAASPTLAAFNRAVALGARDLAVVGLPCQLQALSIMDDARRSCAALRIGLFCTWAFDLRKLRKRLASTVGRREILQLSVSPPPQRTLEIEAEGGAWSVPLDEVRSCVQPACETCWDLTAELSDLSVGSVEGRPGWNTVLVRTQLGLSWIDRARNADMFELEPLSELDLQPLFDASIAKKQRALERVGPDGYLCVDVRLRGVVARAAEEVSP